MKPQPIACTWMEVHDADGELLGALVPQPRYRRVAHNMFGAYGSEPVIEISADRSQASHNHYHAALQEAFDNLPEDVANKYDNVTHFRKDLLIRTGFYDERKFERKIVQDGKHIRVSDAYAQIGLSEDGQWIVVKQAKSQSFAAMGKDEFERSKREVLDYAASLIGVPVGQLRKNAGKSA